ncbi:hypothetical protein [Vibrio rotiferianus]|uniref:hypothetical protein n=1 Tax=Vibrio rotiferianus TaxID=190895 RepID=UPI0002377D33|nr:hypothetical protein [Vibrio rotiferianus]
MNPVGSNSVNGYSSQPAKIQANKVAGSDDAPKPLQIEKNKVTLSDEGKALLAALQDIDQNGHEVKAENKTVGDKVESFAHGALGMDHPDKIKEEEDDSYSAGQYLSAALTVGGIILALV